MPLKNDTPACKQTVAAVHLDAYEAGVMIRISGPGVTLSPLLMITDKDVDEIILALDLVCQRQLCE